MMTSPALSASPSEATVARVGSPDGTITQTTRGADEGGRQRLQRVDVALAVRITVVTDHLMTVTAEPLGHVAAHFPQPDETDLHWSSSRDDNL